MGVWAVGAWLIRCVWLGMLANKMIQDYTGWCMARPV